MQFDEAPQPRPCCHQGVRTRPLQSHPTANKILLPVVGKDSVNGMSQEDPDGVQLSCQNAVRGHLVAERPRTGRRASVRSTTSPDLVVTTDTLILCHEPPRPEPDHRGARQQCQLTAWAVPPQHLKSSAL